MKALKSLSFAIFTTSSFVVNSVAGYEISVSVGVNGDIRDWIFDVDSADTASRYELYDYACHHHRILNSNCPLQVRELVLKSLARQIHVGICAGVAVADAEKCISSIGGALLSLPLGRPSESGVVVAPEATQQAPPHPNFAMYEEVTYGELMADINAWTGLRDNSTAAAREALLVSLSALDDAATVPVAAAPSATWRVIVVGLGGGHVAGMVLAAFPRAVVATADLCVPGDGFATVASRLASHFSYRFELACPSQAGPSSLASAIQSLEGPRVPAVALALDGGVLGFEGTAAALLQARLSALRTGALVVVLACEEPGPAAAWRFAVDLGAVAPKRSGLGWGGGTCLGRVLGQ